jgi:hypothetical protein
MSYEQKQLLEGLLAWSVIALLYLFRNYHPILNRIWNLVRLFLIVLLTVLTVNYAKGKIKEWWSK